MNFCFSIRSELVAPSIISQRIKMEPTSIINKGEVLRPGQTPKVENVWLYTKEIASSDLLDESLSMFIKELKLVESEIKDISKESEINLDIIVELEGSQTGPKINFNPDVINFFADIGGNLGIDIYG